MYKQSLPTARPARPYLSAPLPSTSKRTWKNYTTSVTTEKMEQKSVGARESGCRKGAKQSPDAVSFLFLLPLAYYRLLLTSSTITKHLPSAAQTQIHGACPLRTAFFASQQRRSAEASGAAWIPRYGQSTGNPGLKRLYPPLPTVIPQYRRRGQGLRALAGGPQRGKPNTHASTRSRQRADHFDACTRSISCDTFAPDRKVQPKEEPRRTPPNINRWGLRTRAVGD